MHVIANLVRTGQLAATTKKISQNTTAIVRTTLVESIVKVIGQVIRITYN